MLGLYEAANILMTKNGVKSADKVIPKSWQLKQYHYAETNLEKLKEYEKELIIRRSTKSLKKLLVKASTSQQEKKRIRQYTINPDYINKEVPYIYGLITYII